MYFYSGVLPGSMAQKTALLLGEEKQNATGGTLSLSTFVAYKLTSWSAAAPNWRVSILPFFLFCAFEVKETLAGVVRAFSSGSDADKTREFGVASPAAPCHEQVDNLSIASCCFFSPRS